MKTFIKILLLIALIALNGYFVGKINIVSTDIERFFPVETQTELTNTQLDDSQTPSQLANTRYLFVSSPTSDLFSKLQSEQIIEGFFELPNKQQVYLVLFDKQHQAALLQQINTLAYMGTPIVGDLLSLEFLTDLSHYWLILLLVLLPIIILLTSFRYLLNLLNEVLFFSLLVLSSITALGLSLNSAYLFALLFVYIYVFTLVNQVYYNQIVTSNLILSLLASLVTTWLSAFLLSFSEFGVVSDFGKALMLWIVILTVTLLLRVLLLPRNTLNLQWFTFKKAPILNLKWLSGFVALGLLAIALLTFKPVNVNLNPLAMSSYQAQIQQFETDYALSQPVLFSVQAKTCSFRTMECNQALSTLIEELNNKLPIQYQTISDLNAFYQNFSQATFSDVTPAKFSQFKLGLEMSSDEQYLYSQDYKTAYVMISVSILEPLMNIENLVQFINQNTINSQFTLQVQGNIGKVASHQHIFLEEMLSGLLYIFLLLAVLFTLFYKDIRILISLLPALLSIVFLGGVYAIGGLSFSIMTLIALILFVGLITDNVIHILIAYKTVQNDCFRVVFKPIILANVIMVISLVLMSVTTDGFLKRFGIELALLLTLHLLFIIYLLPTLFKHFVPLKPRLTP